MGFWNRRVYADAAAATPLSSRAKAEFLRVLEMYGNPGALHKEAQTAKKEVEAARKKIAEAIHAHPDEIVFTASGTESNNLAIQGVLRPMLQKNNSSHAITLVIEHQSVLEPLRALEREGLEVTQLAVDKEGLILPTAVPMAIKPNTVFVSVQLVNSEIGTIEPVREIAKELRRVTDRKIYFHTDAAQAPLWVGLDVEKLGVDLMTIDGQKVLGPKGVGALYIRRGTPVEAILWGGKQERGLRAGTENAAAAASFAAALEDAQKGFEKTAAHTATVREYLWNEIKKTIPDAALNGPELGGKRVANNLNLSVPGLNADMATIAMDALGVAVSTRSACDVGDEEPSHVINALGVPRDLAGTAIRITLLPSVSKRDMRRVAAALKEVADRYKK